jgi:hypothetical protein
MVTKEYERMCLRCVFFLFTGSVWKKVSSFCKSKRRFNRRTQPFIFFPLFKHSYMFRSNDDRRQATNTKYQSKVKCIASVFALCDRMDSQNIHLVAYIHTYLLY